MSSPAVPDPQNLRASDADRERVAEVLRQAAGDGRLSMDELDERLDAVYAAKTYAELAPITHDLPDAAAGGVPAPAPARSSDPDRFGGTPSSHGAVAIMGGFTRKGAWVVPPTFSVFCLMGGGEIDLREARFAQREVTIHIVAIMGGCEITVPEDATVHVTGVGIMGAFDHSSPGTGTADGPVITINGLALMGGVDVKRRAPRKPKQDKLDKLQAKRERLQGRLRDELE
jgi:hypothetical protein